MTVPKHEYLRQVVEEGDAERTAEAFLSLARRQPTPEQCREVLDAGRRVGAALRYGDRERALAIVDALP